MKLDKFSPTQNLAATMADASPQLAAQIAQCVKHYLTQFQRIKRQGNAASVVPIIHAKLDAAVAAGQDSNPDLTPACKRGCNHCCHIPLHVTAPEARLMVGEARRIGHHIDADRLRRQLAGHKELPKEERACVFLADGACAIYSVRPMSCRKHHVHGDPDLCDTIKHVGGAVAIINCTHAECIASAAASVFDMDTMQAHVLALLPKESK